MHIKYIDPLKVVESQTETDDGLIEEIIDHAVPEPVQASAADQPSKDVLDEETRYGLSRLAGFLKRVDQKKKRDQQEQFPHSKRCCALRAYQDLVEFEESLLNPPSGQYLKKSA